MKLPQLKNTAVHSNGGFKLPPLKLAAVDSNSSVRLRQLDPAAICSNGSLQLLAKMQTAGMESSSLIPVAVASRGRTFPEARPCHFVTCAWQVRLSKSAHADVESAELCAAFVAKFDTLAGRRDLSFDAAVRAMGGPKSATTATGCKARLVVRFFASGGVAVTSVENAHSGHALGGGHRKAAALSRDELDDLADQVSNREASAATVARAQESLRPGTSVNVNALKSAISRAVRRRRDEQSSGIAAGAGVTDQESQDSPDAFSGCDNHGLFKFGFPRNPSVS